MGVQGQSSCLGSEKVSFIGETRFAWDKQSPLHRLLLLLLYLAGPLPLPSSPTPAIRLWLQLFLVFYPLPSPCRFCFFYFINLILIHSFFLFLIFLHILFYFFLLTLLILLVVLRYCSTTSPKIIVFRQKTCTLYLPIDWPTSRSLLLRLLPPSLPLCLPSSTAPFFYIPSLPFFSFPFPPSLASSLFCPPSSVSTCITNSLSRNPPHHLSATDTSLRPCLLCPSDTPLLSRSPFLSHNHALIRADLHTKTWTLYISVSSSTLSYEGLSIDVLVIRLWLRIGAQISLPISIGFISFPPLQHPRHVYFLRVYLFHVDVQFQYSINIFQLSYSATSSPRIIPFIVRRAYFPWTYTYRQCNL